mmetsp:Transcript_26760/g.63717  ORF Transcript_26760/g.63717 Transcript_26760/m.63717 type:complete len:567 (+) Transcript_26760:299-1999(+)
MLSIQSVLDGLQLLLPLRAHLVHLVLPNVDGLFIFILHLLQSPRRLRILLRCLLGNFIQLPPGLGLFFCQSSLCLLQTILGFGQLPLHFLQVALLLGHLRLHSFQLQICLVQLRFSVALNLQMLVLHSLHLVLMLGQSLLLGVSLMRQLILQLLQLGLGILFVLPDLLSVSLGHVLRGSDLLAKGFQGIEGLLLFPLLSSCFVFLELLLERCLLRLELSLQCSLLALELRVLLHFRLCELLLSLAGLSLRPLLFFLQLLPGTLSQFLCPLLLLHELFLNRLECHVLLHSLHLQILILFVHPFHLLQGSLLIFQLFSTLLHLLLLFAQDFHLRIRLRDLRFQLLRALLLLLQGSMLLLEVLLGLVNLLVRAFQFLLFLFQRRLRLLQSLQGREGGVAVPQLLGAPQRVFQTLPFFLELLELLLGLSCFCLHLLQLVTLLRHQGRELLGLGPRQLRVFQGSAHGHVLLAILSRLLLARCWLPSRASCRVAVVKDRGVQQPVCGHQHTLTLFGGGLHPLLKVLQQLQLVLLRSHAPLLIQQQQACHLCAVLLFGELLLGLAQLRLGVRL